MHATLFLEAIASLEVVISLTHVTFWSERRCAGGALQQGDAVTTVVGIISLLSEALTFLP